MPIKALQTVWKISIRGSAAPSYDTEDLIEHLIGI